MGVQERGGWREAELTDIGISDLIQPASRVMGTMGGVENGLENGIKRRHSDDAASTGIGTFPCPTCDRILSTDYSLRRHMKICERLKERAESKRVRVTAGRRRIRKSDDGKMSPDEGLIMEIIPPDPDSTTARM